MTRPGLNNISKHAEVHLLLPGSFPSFSGLFGSSGFGSLETQTVSMTQAGPESNKVSMPRRASGLLGFGQCKKANSVFTRPAAA